MKYRFEVRWEDWAEFEVDAENEAEASDKIADVVYDYEYKENGLPPFRDGAVARIIAVDGKDQTGEWEPVK
ncbi:MAG: hypothetical protein IJ991_15645 [Thermoguttaceae bacterium]|nr:hypothetical protein [Thermoguttaceae bacterium]MBR2005599.1 hypothetical protein [Thermoguttaceae bacterium]